MKQARRIAGIVGFLLFATISLTRAADEGADFGPMGPYSLASVTIEYAERSVMLGESTVTTITGDGTGSRVSQLAFDRCESVQLSVESKQVFELLELCYRERFFDLRSSYGPPYSPRLQPDGTVEIMSTMVSDAASRSVTVTIGSYSKRVGYTEPGGDPPPIVRELVRRIRELPIRAVSK